MIAIKSAVGVMNAIQASQDCDNISVLLTPALQKQYTDDHHNFVFQDNYLTKDSAKTIVTLLNQGEESEKKARVAALEKKLRESKDKNDERLRDIEKRMIVDEFKGRENASDCMNQFESECTRLDVNTAKDKIKAIRVFMKDSAQNWYTVA